MVSFIVYILEKSTDIAAFNWSSHLYKANKSYDI